MHLRKLHQRPLEWDNLIKAYSSKNLFHESAWLDFLGDAFPFVSIDYLEIITNKNVVGYFPAVRMTKFLISMYSSPHYFGYMSPLFDRDVDQAKLLGAVLKYGRDKGISRIDLCNDAIDPAVVMAAGFTQHSNVTHVCPLDGGEKSVWNNMIGTCRTRIRKAEKSGLVVRVAHDPGFIDDFYPLFAKMLVGKGLKPGYNIGQAKALFHRLHAADRLFALRVEYQGKLIGTAFYPHDDRAMYYGDSAYEPDSLQYCPNNLLHWTAIRMAIERKIPEFNMGGGPVPSLFTTKFGGGLRPLLTYQKNLIPLFHQTYTAYSFFKQNGYKLLEKFTNP